MGEVAEALFAKDVRCVLARLVRKLHRARMPGVEEPAPDAFGQAQQRSMQSNWVTSLLDERGGILDLPHAVGSGLALHSIQPPARW